MPAETSIIWLIAADEASLAMAPQSLKMNQSWSWMTVRTRCQASGQWRCIQSSLGRPNSGAAQCPVVLCSSR